MVNGAAEPEPVMLKERIQVRVTLMSGETKPYST